MWPETLQGTSHIKSKFIYNFIKNISKKIYSSADILFGQSKLMTDNLKEKFPKKLVVYLPSPIQKSIKPIKSNAFRKKLKLDNSINLMFAGNLGDAQNLELIIEISKRYKRKNIKFLIFGTGSKYEYLKKNKEKYDLQNIELFGYQEIKKIPLYFSLADFMLLTLKNKKIFTMTVPNKLMAYMASSKPIISFITGETSSIIKEANGYYIENYSLNSICKILDKALETKKSKLKKFSYNAKIFYEENYTQEIFYERFISGLDKYENIKANLLKNN